MADKRLSLIVDLVNKTEAGFKSLYADLDAAEKRTEKTTQALREIGLIGAAAFGAASLATKKFLQDGAELESQTIAFTTMLGSAEKAAKMLQNLTDFAAKTPFEVQGIRDTAKQLLAMGVSTDSLIPTLKGLGDVAAGLSQPIGRIAYAYGQVRTQGKLVGNDLMQFTSAGVPLLQTLADQYGKTTAEVREMVTAGKIGFPDVAKAFETMSGPGGKFFNMMDKQSQSLNGQISNLKDNITKMSEKIGTALIPIAKEITDKLLVITNAIMTWVQANPKLATTIIEVTLALTGLMVLMGAWGLAGPRIVATIGLLGKAFAAMGAIITYLKATTLSQAWASIGGAGVKAMGALRAATLATTAQFVGLRGAVLATGIGAVIILAVNLVMMFQQLSDATGGFANAFKFAWLQVKKTFYEVMLSIIEGLSELFSKIPGLGDIAKELVDGFKAMGNEVDSEMDSILAGVASTGDAASSAATDTSSAIGSMLDGYGDLSVAAKESGDDAKKYMDTLVDGIAGIRDEIRAAYDDIKKATDDFNKSVGDENKSYENNVVNIVAKANEEKIDLQKQLSEAQAKGNSDQVSDIRDKIKEQDAILKTYKDSALSYDTEIAERRKYLRMNELQQATYDHQQKLVQMQEEYLTDQVLRLQKMLALQEAHVQAMSLIAADKRATVEAELAKKVAFTQRLADEKASLTTWMSQTQSMYATYAAAVAASMALVRASQSSIGISTTTTKKASGARADGGGVQAGRTFLVGERGPELFTPSQSGRINAGMGGTQITLVFSGNTFTDEEYSNKIQKRIVDDLKRAMKLSTV